jgi:hypothetical protein
VGRPSLRQPPRAAGWPSGGSGATVVASPPSRGSSTMAPPCHPWKIPSLRVVWRQCWGERAAAKRCTAGEGGWVSRSVRNSVWLLHQQYIGSCMLVASGRKARARHAWECRCDDGGCCCGCSAVSVVGPLLAAYCWGVCAVCAGLGKGGWQHSWGVGTQKGVRRGPSSAPLATASWATPAVQHFWCSVCAS